MHTVYVVKYKYLIYIYVTCTREIGVSPSPDGRVGGWPTRGAEVRARCCAVIIILLPREIWPTLTFHAPAGCFVVVIIIISSYTRIFSILPDFKKKKFFTRSRLYDRIFTAKDDVDGRNILRTRLYDAGYMRVYKRPLH